tara:strand:- start:15141 stop:15425 length:285 start_codon:yes stop_codon:yes gene_type:complete
MSGIQIPQHLDEPGRVLWMTPDEAVVTTAAVLGCFIMGWLIQGLVAAFFIHHVLRKAKAGLSLRSVLARIYWWVPPKLLGMKRSPDAVIREFQG